MRMSRYRNGVEYVFHGLVVKSLDVEVLAGTPFMEVNDISVRPAKHQVIFGNGRSFTYGSNPCSSENAAARRAVLLRAPITSTTIWPGEFIEIELPSSVPSDSE